MKVQHFDSIEALTSAVDATAASDVFFDRQRSWSGAGRRAAVAQLRAGSAAHVSRVEPFFDAMSDLLAPRRRARTINSVAGGSPDVGAYLAGSPLSMRRRSTVVDDASPLTIVIDLTSSGGIDAADVERRGAAVMALAHNLAAARPVRTIAVCAARTMGSDYAVAVDLPSTLDLARCAPLTTDIATARNLMYGLIYAMSGQTDRGSLQWPFDGIDTYRTRGASIWASQLGVQPEQVLFLAPMFAHDEQVRHPDKFVREAFARYGAASDIESNR